MPPTIAKGNCPFARCNLFFLPCTMNDTRKQNGYAPHKEYAQTKASSGRKLAPQVTEGECGIKNITRFTPSSTKQRAAL